MQFSVTKILYIYIRDIHIRGKGEYIMPEISGILSIGTDYTAAPGRKETEAKPFINSVFDAFNSANNGAPASTSHVG